MNTELNPPPPPVSTEETHPLSVSFFLIIFIKTVTQILSNDCENEDHLLTTNNTNQSTTITTNNSQLSSQLPSTPTIHTHSELYSKTISPTTLSPIDTTVTCSQVWERLASHEKHQNPTSSKSITTPSTSTSSLLRHISFSYDPSNDEEEDTFIDQNEEEEEQENQLSNKRKRSVSTTDSLDDIPALPTATDDPTTSSSSVTTPPYTKKPKIKDPNANFNV